MAQPPPEVTPVSVTVDCAAVDFDLSGDQQALRDAAALLLDGMAGPDALRARVGTGSIVGTLPGAGDVPRDPGADAPRGYAEAVWSALEGGVGGVDLRPEGKPAALPAMDRTRELGVLAFDGTPALFLGGEEAAALLLDRAATLASAEMLGAADHVLALAVHYAKDRV